MSIPAIFFCFGPPKSGTTLLQRCLNMHPDVACPSEHHLDFLADSFSKVFTEYNRGLAITDKRTGGQGATLVSDATATQVFRSTVIALMEQSRHGKRVVGINDNAILGKLDDYVSLFPEAKFIAIFRHPIPRGKSAWHHNLTLSELEGDPHHRNLALQFGSFENWLLHTAREFDQSVVRYRKAFEGTNRATHVLYEDLVVRKQSTLRKLFDFLGLENSADVILRIDQASQFSQMKKSSNHPHFFREAQLRPNTTELSPQLLEKIEQAAGNSCRFLGLDQEDYLLDSYDSNREHILRHE